MPNDTFVAMLEVTIDEKVFKIDLNAEGEKRITIDGKAVSFDMVHLEKHRYHLILGNNSYNLEMVGSRDGSPVVKVNGKIFKPVVKNETDLLLERLGMSAVKKKEVKELIAPMPGLVLDLKVKPGSEVEEGDPLVVLEAMKMENVLKSPTAGVVKDILVSAGQALEKNTKILTFE